MHEPLGLYGNTLSVVVLFILYLWSLYYFFVTIWRYGETVFLKTWNYLYLLFMLYGVIELINTNFHSRIYLINFCTSMLPLYPFYVYSIKGYLTIDIFRLWGLILVPTAFVLFFYGQELAFQSFVGQDVEGVTNNMGYSIAMMLPLFFFWRKKPIVMYICILIITILTILALKRGAIIIVLIGLILILIHSYKISKGGYRMYIGSVILIFLICVGYFIQEQSISNDYLMERYTQTVNGDTSERNEIYSQAYNYITTKMSPLEWFCGIGANGCYKAIKIEAHNDWLEIFISLGVIGSILFVKLWKNGYKTYKLLNKQDLKFLFALVLFLIFTRTFFSMSISDIYIYNTSILGYCLAEIFKNKKSNYYGKISNSI